MDDSYHPSAWEGVIFTNLQATKQYIAQIQKRYRRARKKEKKIILDEVTQTTGYGRKHAIAVLRGLYRHTKKPIKHPRKRRYDILDAIVLAKVCALLSWINSKRIQPQIGVAIESLVTAGELHCSFQQKEKLIKISPATIDRLLKKYKKRPVEKGNSYTKPGTLLKTQIPIRTFADWNEKNVGFFEMDLVGHEGRNASGDFAFTLDFVEVHVQWTEQICVRNKAQSHVFEGIKIIRGRLPFPLLGVDSDSGSEFINYHLLAYCTTEKLTFTRGRAGKKNDNPFVEEKNNSVVRRWVGYSRYDTQQQVDILNEFYGVLRLYTNFFFPVQKLLRKERIGSKIKKTHDTPKTPYQRVLDSQDVSEEVKNRLREQYKTLNLVYLKRQVDAILKRLKPSPVG